MIAIAGAKGGCGKTVTTIGLTEAFARSGTPAVAVDADRQLPNLHVVAGVDRDPTLAALEESVEPRTVAQRSPRTAEAGVVAAAEPAAGIDVETAFDRIDAPDRRTLVDCPSGVGPDVVEPLSAADGVIVVATDDERSLEAAAATTQLATRLEVPVVGVVLNRCTELPGDVRSQVDAPILGRVPETEAPLADDASRDAYADVVDRLRRWSESERTPPASETDLLATGIDPLDRTLGGFTPGTVAALVAEPASQAEHLLYAATAPRGTLYLATERSAASVDRAVDSTPVETGTPTVRTVGEDALAETGDLLERLPNGATLVVDPVDVLERADRRRYVSLVEELADRIAETGGIALLHCLAGGEIPANRSATMHAADVVLEFESAEPGVRDRTESGARGAAGRRLSVSKCRDDDRLAASIDLEDDGSEPIGRRVADDGGWLDG